MCTLSWLTDAQGYQLFFNRDEQRGRGKALAPQFYGHSGVSVCMPLDPDGGGSWISVNENGLALCLLNYYQGETPPDPLTSRGLLLRSLSHHIDLGTLNTDLLSIDFNQYAAFTLIAFAQRTDSEADSTTSDVQGYQWNGRTFRAIAVNSPMTSSSVDFETVSRARKHLYTTLYTTLNSAATTEAHIAYHTSHTPEKGHSSVCMHRSDAKSVSFSHIEVNSTHIAFHYHDGSPCSLQTPYEHHIDPELPKIRPTP